MQILSERIRPVDRLFGMAENRYGFSEKTEKLSLSRSYPLFKGLYPFSQKSLDFFSKVPTLFFERCSNIVRTAFECLSKKDADLFPKRVRPFSKKDASSSQKGLSGHSKLYMNLRLHIL